MNEDTQGMEADWERLRPLLDEAVGGLREGEREAVLLRYFKGLSHREVGAALGLNEESARKRVERALEKLRGYFARRGVVVSAGLLGSAMSAHGVEAAPAGLAGSWSASAVSGVGSAGVVGVLGKILGLGTKTQAVGVAAVMVGVSIPLIGQFQENARLRGEVAAAEQAQVGLQQGDASAWKAQQAVGGHTQLTDAEIEAQVQAAVGLRLKTTEADAHVEMGMMAQWYPSWTKFLTAVDAADMPRVLAHVEQVSYVDTRTGLRAALLGIWAKSNGPAAMAYAQALPEDANAPLRNLTVAMMEEVLAQWAKQDLPAAEAWLEQLPEDGNRDQMLISMAPAIGQKDPQGAFDYIKSHSSGSGGDSMAYQGLFDILPAADFTAMAEEVAALPMAEQVAAVQGFGEAWGKSDPAAAAAWADHLTGDGAEAAANLQNKENFLKDVLWQWAKSDPTSALDWAGQVANDDERKNAYGNIMLTLKLGKAQVAQAYLETMSAGTARDELQQVILEALGPSGQEAALEAIAEMPEGNAKDSAILKLVNSWAQTSPLTGAGQATCPMSPRGRRPSRATRCGSAPII